jgi:hypothetical protein
MKEGEINVLAGVELTIGDILEYLSICFRNNNELDWEKIQTINIDRTYSPALSAWMNGNKLDDEYKKIKL